MLTGDLKYTGLVSNYKTKVDRMTFKSDFILGL